MRTLAGSTTVQSGGVDGVGTVSLFAGPHSMYFASGLVYVTEFTGLRIRTVTTAGRDAFCCLLCFADLLTHIDLYCCRCRHYITHNF